MCPRPCSRRIGSAAWVTHSAPNRFVSICARTCSSETSSIDPEEAVAGVVDDDVERPKRSCARGDRGVDRRLVGDVELDRQDVVAVALDQVVERGGVTRGGGDAVAALERGLGPDAAEALRVPVMNQTSALDVGCSVPPGRLIRGDLLDQADDLLQARRARWSNCASTSAKSRST